MRSSNLVSPLGSPGASQSFLELESEARHRSMPHPSLGVPARRAELMSEAVQGSERVIKVVESIRVIATRSFQLFEHLTRVTPYN